MRVVHIFLVIVCIFDLLIVSDQDLIQLDRYDYNDEPRDGQDGSRSSNALVGSGRDSDDYYKDYEEDFNKEDLFQKAIFNVTTNFIVPMVQISFPKYSTTGDPLDLVYQVMFAGFGILAATVYIGLPSLMATILKSQDSLYEDADAFEINNRAKSVGKRSVAKVDCDRSEYDSDGINHAYFIEKIGLDWRECLKKTVCQAHEPTAGRHYGLLVIPFQILFPQPVNSNVSLMSNGSDSQSMYRQATGDGHETSHKEECGHIYNCFFDVLGLGMQLTDMYAGLIVRNNL